MSSQRQQVVSNGGGSPLRSPPTSPQPQQPPPFAIVRLAAAIRSNIERIAEAERSATGQTELATRHQCDLALRFIAHYAAHKAGEHILESAAYAGGGAATVAGAEVFEVEGGRERSLFEVFTGLAVHLRVGHAVAVRLDRARAYLKEASILGDCCSTTTTANHHADDDELIPSTLRRPHIAPFTGGATQIIFDSGDAAAAFAELNTAHADCTAPWRIRLCWVQESLRSHFEDTFRLAAEGDRLSAIVRPLGGAVRRTSSSGALVVDVPLALWPPKIEDDEANSDEDSGTFSSQQIVLVQFFRTCKDAIGLLRKQQPTHSVQSLSVWTENVSVTLELAHALPAARNIWQNCVGLLDPQVPFTFRGDGAAAENRIYGSELALCQTVIRRQSASVSTSRLDAKRLGVVFAAELAAEAGDYSAMRQLERVAFMTSARRRQRPDEAVAEWVVQARDVQKRRLITNVVFNEFQTIVLPYGTIFAN